MYSQPLYAHALCIYLCLANINSADVICMHILNFYRHLTHNTRSFNINVYELQYRTALLLLLNCCVPIDIVCRFFQSLARLLFYRRVQLLGTSAHRTFCSTCRGLFTAKISDLIKVEN